MQNRSAEITPRIAYLVLLGLVATFLAGAKIMVFADFDQWREARPLPAPLASQGVIVRGRILYLVGGKNNTGNPVREVFYARINDDSSLADWQQAESLPISLYAHATVANNDYLYAIGGYDGENVRAEVWRAAFQADGGISNWQEVGKYPLPIALHDATMVGNHLYVVGGTSKGANERTKRIYFTAIQANGDLGPWQRAPDLPQALYRLSVTAHNSHLYVTGGYDGANRSNIIYYARVLANGDLGPWQTATMPLAREYHQALIYNGRLALLGGRDAAASAMNRVDSAVIDSNDGGLSGWRSEPDLPHSLYRFGTASASRNGADDTIYVLGGLSANNNDYRSEVYHSFTALTPRLPPHLRRNRHCRW